MKYLPIILVLFSSCSVSRFEDRLLVATNRGYVLTAEHIGDAMCCRRQSLWIISDLSDRLIPDSLIGVLIDNGAPPSIVCEGSSIAIETENGGIKMAKKILKLTAKNLGKQ